MSDLKYSPSFIFFILYLVIELVRPQTIYPQINIIPFGKLFIGGLFLSSLMEGRLFHVKNPLNSLLFLFLVWVFISTLFAFDHDVALNMLSDFIKWIIIYFLAINTINEKNKFYWAIFFILLFHFKMSQYSFRGWVASGFYSSIHGTWTGAGFFQNPNDFAVALNTVTPISYYLMINDQKKIFGFLKSRWIYFIFFLSFFMGVLITSSRGGMLGLGVISLGIWYKTKRKFLFLFPMAICVFMFLNLLSVEQKDRIENIGKEKDESAMDRINLWRDGIRIIQDYPITGVGIDNFRPVSFKLYNNDKKLAPHNIYIQAASELGLPGLIIFLSILITVFQNHKNIRKQLEKNHMENSIYYQLSHAFDLSVIGFAVNGFFITVLYYPFLWIILTLSVAMMSIVNKDMAKLKIEGS